MRYPQHARHSRAIAEPLIESKFIPLMAAQMIAEGEEMSELDSMVNTLSLVIEPVIILLLGLLVALILVSRYLPMFDLMNVVVGG